MNLNQKRQFREKIRTELESVRNFIKLGEGRGVSAREGNFKEIYEHLEALGIATNDGNMNEAAAIVSEAFTNRPVEIQRPPTDNTARAIIELVQVERSSTNVRLQRGNISVRLDSDQNKHQHPNVPIGSRSKTGGTRFVNTCNVNWHLANTLNYMANWAGQLPATTVGTKTYHGQSAPVSGIHYEGYCFFAPNDQRVVVFHCYPAKNTALIL